MFLLTTLNLNLSANEGLNCNSLISPFLIVKKIKNKTAKKIGQELLQSKLADQYTKEKMQTLRPAKTEEVSAFFSTSKESIKEMMDINLDIPGITKHWTFYKSKHPAINDLYLTVILVDPDTHVSGFLIKRFSSQKDDPLVFLEFIKIDPKSKTLKGKGQKLLKIGQKLEKHYGVSKYKLEADWVGRYVWAKSGYQFSEETICTYNGIPNNSLDVTRRNFQNFLNHFNIEISDLTLETNGKIQKIKSINDLSTPLHFVTLKHSKGRKLQIRPYIDNNTLGDPQLFDIGKAFSLMDYRARPNQTNVIIDSNDGFIYSDISMIVWQGFRFL